MFAFLLLLSVLAVPGFSQYEYFYGKNKVVKQSYNWKYIELPHFNIHYYTQDENLIKKIAKAAEYSYNKISDYLGIRVKDRIPIIFYSTGIDFELTNIAGYVPAGAVAFAESTTYRLVIQGDAPFDELASTITHELSHIFEYEIMGASSRFISPPLWIMEGFCEFMTGKWDEFSLLTVRDMVLFDRIPQLAKNGELETQYYNDRIIPYDFGHMVYEFLDMKFGKRGVKNLLHSLKSGAFLRFTGRNDVLKVLDYTPKMFNHEFGKYLRERFKDYVIKENPEDYSYIIGPDNPYAYSFSHEVSPSGEMVAVLTANMNKGSLDIILISMKDGKVLKRITPGLTGIYDNISLNFDPTNGTSFTWNKDSDKIAFFARKEWDNYLFVMDVLTGKILEKHKIDVIQQPSAPNFHPTENKLYFSGQESTKSYLYSIDLDTWKITKLTTGMLFIRAFDISKDGKLIVYSAKGDNGHYKIYLGTLENPEMSKQITFGDFNDITPSFSADGRTVYFSSNEMKTYNVNAIDLEEKIKYQYTDVMTGCFFPLENPGEKNQVVISAYYKGQFSLFKKDIAKVVAKQPVEFELIDAAKYARKEAEEIDVTGLDIKHKGKYRPFKKLYVKSLPPLEMAIGSDGSFFGYSELTLSDLMGDIELSLMIATFYGYKSYHLTYLNMRNRLQFYAHLFANQQVYYSTGYVSNYYQTLRSSYGGEAGFFYPFSRSYRAEATLGFYKQNEKAYTDLQFGQFVTGWAVPLRLSLVGETTMFGNYGPNKGHTFKLTYEKYIKLGNKFIDSYAFEGDIRKYIRLDNYTLLAFRLSGYKSGGKNPLIYWTGGNNTLRAVDLYSLTGNNIALFNAEFRFALIHLAATPIGLVGPIRGSFFFDLGGAWLNGEKFRFFEKGKKLRLQDALSSYGFGIQFFFFGYPMHFDWVWRTDLKQKTYNGVNFWIGYDF